MTAGVFPNNETGKVANSCKFGDEEVLVYTHYMLAYYGCVPAFALGKFKIFVTNFHGY
jgi:hypothetical protein